MSLARAAEHEGFRNLWLGWERQARTIESSRFAGAAFSLKWGNQPQSYSDTTGK